MTVPVGFTRRGTTGVDQHPVAAAVRGKYGGRRTRASGSKCGWSSSLGLRYWLWTQGAEPTMIGIGRRLIVDGYIRVSKVAGRQGERFISPRVQQERIERWASVHDAHVARFFVELDESGARADRPLLLEAIQRVERGDSEGVVVAYLSRFGRSLMDALHAIERIRAAGGTFVSVEDGLDLSTDTGRLVLKLMLSVAEWELDRMRSNSRIACRRAAARGVFPGPTPFGYRRRSDGRLAIDAGQAAIVREIFDKRAAGWRAVDVQRMLNERGVPTATGKNYWHEGTVADLTRKRVYLGEVAYDGVVTRDAHPPLVDHATWECTQRRGARLIRHRGESTALLAGLVRCAGCQRTLRTTVNASGSSGQMRTYECGRSAGLHPCPAPASIRDRFIEPYVEALFWQQLRAPKRATSPQQLARLRETIERRERELVTYRDNPRLPTTIGPERFAAGLEVRARRLELARVDISRAELVGSEPRLPPAAELEARWQSLSVLERRELIAEAIESAFVRKGSARVEKRTLVYPRGRGPADLPSHRATCEPRPFDFATFPGALRLATGSDWDEARVRSELEEFVAGWDRWPSFPEFQEAGRALLYRQLERHGGRYLWASRCTLPYLEQDGQGRPWTDERIRTELGDFLAGRSSWPGCRAFDKCGKRSLRHAVRATGGPSRWAPEVGVSLPRAAREEESWGYARMREEVARLAAGRRDWPSYGEFHSTGRRRLYQAVLRAGVRKQLAAQLRLRLPVVREPITRRWTDDQVEAVLGPFLAGRERWPLQREFDAAGLAGLRVHLQAAGRRSYWAARFGVALPKPRRPWTDDRISAVLDDFLAGRDRFPAQDEFRSAGHYGLWMHLYRAGTRARWAARYDLPCHCGTRRG